MDTELRKPGDFPEDDDQYMFDATYYNDEQKTVTIKLSRDFTAEEIEAM
jgi:hypothetical protein